jgi:GT2 family glycosyltransferase/lipopolysaccharide/colanic/teichoic acid biosynthesis glycosyltransferase
MEGTAGGRRKGGVKLPVSVIVVTYNSMAVIGDCLRSLAGGAEVEEVLVVDNASDDGGPEWIEREFPWVRVLRNERNVGYARGVNRGLREAKGRHGLVINPDVRVRPGAIAALCRRLEEDPSAGIVGPKLLNPDGSLQYSCRRFYTPATFIARRTFLGRLLRLGAVDRAHLMVDADHDRTMSVDWLIGAAMLVRREALDDVGPMDERFFLYFEDVDWCYRMEKRGWRVLYHPEAVMVHQHQRESARKPLGRSLRSHLASWIRFYEKWSGLLYFVKLNRPLLTGLALLLTDLVALNAAFLLAYLARGSMDFVLEKPVFPLRKYFEYLAVIEIVAVASLYIFGLYRRGRDGDWADRLVDVGRAVFVATTVVMALTFLAYRQTYSRSMLVLYAVFATILVTALRGLLFRLYSAAVSRRFDRRRLAVIGPEEALAPARAQWQRSPEPGFEPLFVTRDAAGRGGRPETVLPFLQGERVSDVILLWKGEWPEAWLSEIPSWTRAGITVRIAPEFGLLLGGSVRVDAVGGVPALRLERSARPGLLGLGKRANDAILATILLLVLAVPFGWLIVWRSLGGRVPRVFRARAAGPSGDVWIRRLEGVRSPILAAFPGFASVLAGNAALVGITPLPSEAVLRLPPVLRAVHAEARPGVLGPWALRTAGGAEASRWQDLEYVRGWTLVRDWKILVRSFGRVAAEAGAPVSPPEVS